VEKMIAQYSGLCAVVENLDKFKCLDKEMAEKLIENRAS
jgi:hypothetical protein